MKTFTYSKRPGLEISIKCEDEDYLWLKALFERNSKPFTALRDIGFDLKRKENEDA